MPTTDGSSSCSGYTSVRCMRTIRSPHMAKLQAASMPIAQGSYTMGQTDGSRLGHNQFRVSLDLNTLWLCGSNVRWRFVDEGRRPFDGRWARLRRWMDASPRCLRQCWICSQFLCRMSVFCLTSSHFLERPWTGSWCTGLLLRHLLT